MAVADEKGNELVAAEKLARDYSARMLAGVKAAHGSNSSQYEMAGGTRDDERKRPVRQKKA